MNQGDLNFRWARSLLSGLIREGLTEVVIAPGSRSAPLVLAAASFPELSMRVQLDERSAGFFALGYGKRSGRPAVVITTSGTAVANLFPAVVEADLADAPLLLLTADRPPRLRGRDANQTIDQPEIFGSRTRWSADLPAPSEKDGEGEAEGIARRAWARAAGPPAGPVHLNQPFDKPLEPSVDRIDLSAGIARPQVEAARRRAPTAADLAPAAATLERLLLRARRPLIVAGPSARPQVDGPALARFARSWGVPLLADPLSGARYCGDAAPDENDVVLGAGAHLLAGKRARSRLEPDLLLRTGRTPTSGAIEEAVASWGGSMQVVVDDGSRRKDHQRLATRYIEAPLAGLFERVATPPAPPGRGGWRGAWLRLEKIAWEALDALPHADHEGAFARALFEGLPKGSTLIASSSMPVRDLDGYVKPAGTGSLAFANRGASGIDGVVSTALGCAAAESGPVGVLIGDLAFLHDLGGLGVAPRPDGQVVFVVLDNDGGGIFEMLPTRRFGEIHTRYFATPHGLDLSLAARLHHVPCRAARTLREFRRALDQTLESGATSVIHVRVGRRRNAELHARDRTRVRARIEKFLSRHEWSSRPGEPKKRGAAHAI